MRLKEKEDIEKKTEVQSNSKNGKKFELIKTKNYVERRQIQNSTNSFDCHGSEANVFKQEFNYPPTKEEKIKNNKIYKVECIFPEEKMIPQGFNEKRCKSHDNVFL